MFDEQIEANTNLYFTGGRRASAAILDALACSAISAALLFLMADTNSSSPHLTLLGQDGFGVEIVMYALPFFVYVTYAGLQNKRWGRTLGKRIMGLKLLDTDSRQTPSLVAVLKRETLNGFAFLFLSLHLPPLVLIVASGLDSRLDVLNTLLFCWVLLESGFVVFSRNARAIHDIVANTTVIHHPHPLRPRRVPG